MEHDLDPAHGVVHPLVRAQLSFDHLDVEALEVRAVAGREVVEHAHVVPGVEQRAHEVRADEPAASGHECLHSVRASRMATPATPTASQVNAARGIPATSP